MKAWNLKQLQEAKLKDLQSCHTQFERTMVETICNKEIRELAIQLQTTRKLTPMEQAILENLK
jgi:hypothetical protein